MPGEAKLFAIRGALVGRLVNGLIGGPRTMAQWQDYLNALGQAFSADDEAFFSSLVPAGHASTPGYTDAQYPVAGRVPTLCEGGAPRM